MNTRTVSAVLFSFLLFAACNLNSSKPDDIQEIITIDFSRNMPEKVVKEIVDDVKFIVLETTDEVLIEALPRIAYVSQDLVMLYNTGEGSIYTFNHEGKIMSNFNRTGQGPMEYNSITGLTYDEINKEIYVVDDRRRRRMQVYSETGQYKRTLPFPDNMEFEDIFSFDDELLLVHDTYGIGIVGLDLDRGQEANAKPYVFLSKKDGSIAGYVDITLSQRISTSFAIGSDPSSQYVRVSRYSTCGIIKNGPDFLLADIASDTVYLLTRDKKPTPLIVRKPSVHDTNPQELLGVTFRTDNLLLISKWVNERNRNRSNTLFFTYDFSDHRFYKVKDYNTIFPNDQFLTTVEHSSYGDCGCDYNDKGTIVNVRQAFALKEQLEEGVLKGKLKDIAMKLDAEDNPVLVIIKMK